MRQLSVATSVGGRRGSAVGIDIMLRAGRSADRIPDFIFSKTSRLALEPTQSSDQCIPWSFPVDKGGRGTKLTILRLERRLRTSGALYVIPLYAFIV